MKTFEQTLEDIQKAINAIGDKDEKLKAQQQFDTIPKDKSQFYVDTYNGNLKTKLTADATPFEIEQAYVRDLAKYALNYYKLEREKYYIDDKFYVEPPEVHDGIWQIRLQDMSNNGDVKLNFKIINPRGEEIESKTISAEEIASQTFYVSKGSKLVQPKNPDIRQTPAYTVSRYEIMSYENFSSFETEIVNADDTEVAQYYKKKSSKTEGVGHKTDRYQFCSRQPNVQEITEIVHELGRDNNLNVYAKDGEKTILIQDGKIIKITQTQSIETNGTKQTQNKKVELGENNQFTKEIKEQKTEEVKNFVEKGVLPPDGKLSLSLKGSKVEQNLSTAASQGV